jgi:hypothetical protein
MRTQRVECPECQGEKNLVLFGRKECCDVCNGDGSIVEEIEDDMTDQTEQWRKEFERWCACTSMLATRDGDGYLFHEVQSSWLAYLAAKQSSADEIARLKTAHAEEWEGYLAIKQEASDEIARQVTLIKILRVGIAILRERAKESGEDWLAEEAQDLLTATATQPKQEG